MPLSSTECEATEAPIDHIRISRNLQEAILEKFYQKQAFSEEKAITEQELKLTDAERQLFGYLVLKGIIMELEKNSQSYFYLNKKFLPSKNYRKEVVMSFSILILIFLTFLLSIGLGAIIVSVISFMHR